MMLNIKDLEIGYDKKQVLYGLSMEVRVGEIVTIIGPNGAGKSTILKAVCGLIPVWKGKIYFDSVLINGSPPSQNVVRGIVFAPQGNRVFDELTVLDNLKVGGFLLSPKNLKHRIDEVLDIFPLFKERVMQDAGKLSGGEKQMLALARALVPQPKLLMLDEPSLGLSPGLAVSVFDRISGINRSSGLTILIVEQKVREVLDIAHRVYSIRLGRVAFNGLPKDLKDNKEKLKELFLTSSGTSPINS